MVTSARPVGSIVAGTCTTGPDGTVGGGGVIGGRAVVLGTVVACDPPSDPPLHAPHTVSTVNANTAHQVLAGVVVSEVIKMLNLPPRGAPIVRLLRL